MDFHIRLGAVHRRLARPAHPSCPHPGDERRKLSARHQQEGTAAIGSGAKPKHEAVESDFDELQLSAALRRVLDYLPCRLQNRPGLSTGCNRFGRIEAVLERVPTTFRGLPA